MPPTPLSSVNAQTTAAGRRPFKEPQATWAAKGRAFPTTVRTPTTSRHQPSSPEMGLYVASLWGTYPRCVRCLGGYEWGYVAERWVWSIAAAKSIVRGWKLCHAACLQAVSRASFASTAPTLATIGQAGWGGWLVRAATSAAS